jgi:hypothetical protein
MVQIGRFRAAAGYRAWPAARDESGEVTAPRIRGIGAISVEAFGGQFRSSFAQQPPQSWVVAVPNASRVLNTSQV